MILYLDCFFILACSIDVGEGLFKITLNPLKYITGTAGTWYKAVWSDLSWVATIYLLTVIN